MPSSEEEFNSSFISRGSPSQYERTEYQPHIRSHSADRSYIEQNDHDTSPGDPGCGGSGTLRRRYQPTNHGRLGVVHRASSDRSEVVQRRRGSGDQNVRGGQEVYTDSRQSDVRQPRPPDRGIRGESLSFDFIFSS
jgi:hypothetical protein